jgi:hypothetical protein
MCRRKPGLNIPFGFFHKESNNRGRQKYSQSFDDYCIHFGRHLFLCCIGFQFSVFFPWEPYFGNILNHIKTFKTLNRPCQTSQCLPKHGSKSTMRCDIRDHKGSKCQAYKSWRRPNIPQRFQRFFGWRIVRNSNGDFSFFRQKTKNATCAPWVSLLYAW